jgi:hypothetical protein
VMAGNSRKSDYGFTSGGVLLRSPPDFATPG